jgi:hypothetical protein
MSADNYIFIDQEKKPIEIWSCVASETVESHEKKDLNYQKIRLIGTADTLGDAVLIASLDGREEEAEYGISFSLWAK